jgi:nucleotide-binding universal stress UspA family protein
MARRNGCLSNRRWSGGDPGDVARTQLQDIIRAASPGRWDVEVATGQTVDTIVRVAEERNVDLIVIGTHGRTGLQHVLLGSVPKKVVRLAPCPVLTVRYKETAVGARPFDSGEGP